jgi:hypothetical protein
VVVIMNVIVTKMVICADKFTTIFVLLIFIILFMCSIRSY